MKIWRNSNTFYDFNQYLLMLKILKETQTSHNKSQHKRISKFEWLVIIVECFLICCYYLRCWVQINFVASWYSLEIVFGLLGRSNRSSSSCCWYIFGLFYPWFQTIHWRSINKINLGDRLPEVRTENMASDVIESSGQCNVMRVIVMMKWNHLWTRGDNKTFYHQYGISTGESEFKCWSRILGNSQFLLDHERSWRKHQSGSGVALRDQSQQLYTKWYWYILIF